MAHASLVDVINGTRPDETYFRTMATVEAAGILTNTALQGTGAPANAVAPAPGLAGAALTAWTGQLRYTNPPGSGKRLARLSITTSTPGTILLFDRLWHNSGIAVTTTTAQTINSVAWPARDRNGSTNGEDVMVGIEVFTQTSNAGVITNTTMSYTNEAGTSGRTATLPSWPATALAGTFVPFALAAGDLGIRSVQSVTLGTSYGGGVINLVAYRKLAAVGAPSISKEYHGDPARLGIPRVYDNTVPVLFWCPSSTSGPTIEGSVAFTEEP